MFDGRIDGRAVSRVGHRLRLFVFVRSQDNEMSGAFLYALGGAFRCDVEHPVDAEFVGDHAKGVAPRGFL